MKQIEIPTSVENLAVRCFAECKSLLSIVFAAAQIESKESLEILYQNCFVGCKCLEFIRVGHNMTFKCVNGSKLEPTTICERNVDSLVLISDKSRLVSVSKEAASVRIPQKSM